jgi:integrase
MKKISTSLQAKNAKAGVYSVTGASGFGFKKDSDVVGVGSYTVRYRLGARRPTMGLGAFSEISLADAREAAIEAVKLARRGIDPIERRKREKVANLAAERAKQPITFRQAAEAYCELHAPSWKHRYAVGVWLNPIKKYAYPIIGDFPLNDIEPRHIIAIRSAANKGTVPEPGQKRRGSKGPAPEAGQRVQRRIRKILSAAIVTGERDRARGNPADAELIAAVLPSKRKGERPHFRRIEKIDDAPEAFRALCEARKGAQGLMAPSLDAWLFMIACAARPSEALHARWSEIDRAKRLWTLPKARMKSEREHIVPLSALALEVLERRALVRTGAPPVGDSAVFSGWSGSPVGYSNFGKAPAKLGLDLAAPHSWRSIFRDWCHSVGRISRDLAEEALAHSLGTVEGAYRRDPAVEARAPVMEAYACWLAGDAVADVIAFPSRA